MLRKWIEKETYSKREILKEYHKALLGIDLIADAENFMKKLKKPDDADGNGRDDDSSDDKGEEPDIN